MSKILVTGGTGFVGSCLVPRLLADGHEVVVFDNGYYSQTSLLDMAGHKRLTPIRGDVRDLEALIQATKNCDAIVHLAGIVGAPACHRDPELSEAVNVEGTRNIIRAANGRYVLFPSTGSSYGHVASGLCTEDTPISPLSVYGNQKAHAETYVRENARACVIFRFATAFGASARPRLDLLPNDFVHRAVTQKSLVVYEAEFRRTFIHVRDMARVFQFALEREGALGQIYNVGDEALNLTKREVAEKIVARVPGCLLNVAGDGKDPDARNYWVDYTRIKSTGFKCEVSFDEGLDELFKAEQLLTIRTPFSNA